MYSMIAKRTDGLLTSTFVAFNYYEWLLLAVGSAFSIFVVRWTGQLLGIPHEPGFNGSLFASGAPVLFIFTLVISLSISIVVASVIASSVEPDSGLFCCCMGLAAWAIHCGPMRPVLQYASGPHVLVVMCLESMVLAGAIGAAWFFTARLLGRKTSVADNEIADATLVQKLQTLGVQIVVMGICELLFIQTDTKAQVIAGVGVAAFLGSLSAYTMTPLAEAVWYWAGPVAVGIIGYLATYFGNGSVSNGDLTGWAAALARATPLDYAGVGISGALLGYWTMRRWSQPEVDLPEDPIVSAPVI